MDITIPYNFIPRNYQQPVMWAMDPENPERVKRGFCVWHRRSGKDKTFLNFMISMMCRYVGIYYYFFPNYAQGKKILWEGIDRDGFPYLGHFPKDYIDGRPNNTEMKIRLKNKSLFQIIGTDNIDSIVGTNPIGAVFSEYPLQDPAAWRYIKSILTENGGWALFNGTPRGRNHAYKLFHNVKDSARWFVDLLTVDDTKRPDGTPVIHQDMIDAEREEDDQGEDFIQQEYWCSWDAQVASCFFRDSLARHKIFAEGDMVTLEKDRNGIITFEREWKTADSPITVWRYPYHELISFDGIPWTNRYCIGSDIAEGLGGTHDYSVAYVFDRLLREFVCKAKSNTIDAVKWGDLLYMLSQWYDNCLICPERTGAGITTIKRLLDLKANLYVREIPGKLGSPMTKEYGWNNNSKQAKQDLAGDLKDFFYSTKGTVHCKELLDESAVFIKKDDGTLAADAGFHDDCVIAAGCAVKAHLYIADQPEQIKPERITWYERNQSGGDTAWTR